MYGARRPPLHSLAAWLLVALAFAPVLAAGAERAGETPSDAPCRVRADVDARTAFVGEQVIHRLRIAWRDPVVEVDWLRTPAFPHHVARPLSPGPVATTRDAHGRVWREREERRALFAGHAGSLAVPPAVVRCRLAVEPGRAAHVDVTLPAMQVEARPTPAEGRPADWDGLVGAVDLRRSVARQRVALGTAVRLTVRLRGPAPLGAADVLPPLPATDPPSFEVFAGDERSTTTTGDRLDVRRTAYFDLVPRRIGTIVLPEQSVAWLDPASARYHESVVPPIAIEVTAPAAAGLTADATGADGIETAPPASAPEPSWLDSDRIDHDLLRTVLAAIAVALLSFGAAWLLFRVRPGHRGLDAALRAADAAHARGDRRQEAEALEQALRAALARRSPALAGLSPPELEWRGAEDEALVEAADLLADLDESRFGAEPRVPDRDAVRGWIARSVR